MKFVVTVVTCGVGNPYGTSNAAWQYYRHMIQNFSPAEVAILLAIPGSNTVVGKRIAAYKRCRMEFGEIVSFVDSDSVPTRSKKVYDEWK